jgi:hypothetical protein
MALGKVAKRLQAEFRTRGAEVRLAIDRDPRALL